MAARLRSFRLSGADDERFARLVDKAGGVRQAVQQLLATPGADAEEVRRTRQLGERHGDGCGHAAGLREGRARGRVEADMDALARARRAAAAELADREQDLAEREQLVRSSLTATIEIADAAMSALREIVARREELLTEVAEAVGRALRDRWPDLEAGAEGRRVMLEAGRRHLRYVLVSLGLPAALAEVTTTAELESAWRTAHSVVLERLAEKTREIEAGTAAIRARIADGRGP